MRLMGRRHWLPGAGLIACSALLIWWLIASVPESVTGGQTGTDFGSAPSSYNEPTADRVDLDGSRSAATGSIAPYDYAGQESVQFDANDLERFDVLMEIGNRLAEVQITEAENELRALIDRMDQLSDTEKLAFLDFVIRFTRGNLTNPEALVAFDQLWRMLELSPEMRSLGARQLATHYLDIYEFEMAIGQFESLLATDMELDATQLKEYGHALFQMHDYQAAATVLLDYTLATQSADGVLAREPLSELFEAYYRTGDNASAERIGLEILNRFDDIQDWKDMVQFYTVTGDSQGLAALELRAVENGLRNEAGAWAP